MQLDAIIPIKPTEADSQILSDEQLRMFTPPVDILGDHAAGNTPDVPARASESELSVGQASESRLDVGQLVLRQVTESGLVVSLDPIVCIPVLSINNLSFVRCQHPLQSRLTSPLVVTLRIGGCLQSPQQ